MMCMEAVVNIIALVMALVGVLMVYDARLITKKLFGFGDQNQAAWGLKILGFIVAIIGALIIYFWEFDKRDTLFCKKTLTKGTGLWVKNLVLEK